MSNFSQANKLEYETSSELKTLVDNNILPVLNSANSLIDDVELKIKSETGGSCNNSNLSSAQKAHCSVNDFGKWKGAAGDTFTISSNYLGPVYSFFKQQTGEENLLKIKEIFQRIIKWFDEEIPNILNKLNQKIKSLANKRVLNLFNKLYKFINKAVPYMKKLLNKALKFAANHKGKLLKLGKFFNKFFVFLAGFNLGVAVLNKNITGTINAIISIILIFVGLKFGLIAAIISIVLLIIDEIFMYFFDISLIQMLLLIVLKDIKERIDSLISIFRRLPNILDSLLNTVDVILKCLIQIIEFITNSFQTIFEYLEIVNSTISEAVSDVMDYAESITDNLFDSAFGYISEKLPRLYYYGL